MSNICNSCGLEESDFCNCHLFELENRIFELEEDLDELTQIVKKISDYLKEEDEDVR